MAKNIVLAMPLETARDIVYMASRELDLLQVLLERIPHPVSSMFNPDRIRRLDELNRVLEEAVANEDRENEESKETV